MTTPAMKRRTTWKRSTLRIATWNVMAWANKDQEIIMELSEKKIDMCAINETKKKGKGKIKVAKFILIYSGVPKHQRAKSGVGLLIHQKYQDIIEEEEFINDRILRVAVMLEKSKTHFISVYAPDISKPVEVREKFYDDLQHVIHKIPAGEKFVILGDLNAKVGNEHLPGIMQRFNEETINDNGDLLITFCAANLLRINNTFFNHSMQYKYTWQNTRGQESVLDYIITNRAIQPYQILDVRTLNSANIGSDHKLLLCTLRLSLPHTRKPKSSQTTKYNIESFDNESTRQLYEGRLSVKIVRNPINNKESIDQQWEHMQQHILDTANEAIGLRKIKTNANANSKTPWFCPEVKDHAQRKKKAYIQFLRTKSAITWQQYVQERNKTNAEIRKIKQNYWESFSKQMEGDLYGGQRRIWGMLRKNKLEVKDTVQTSKISIEEWTKYFTNLYEAGNASEQLIYREDNEEQLIGEEPTITEDEVCSIIKSLKNRKSTGPDQISNEMVKYGGPKLTNEIWILLKNILEQRKIPEKWKESILIPIFKKGEKQNPENYRGITLLNSVLKIFTKLILNKLSNIIPIREEQQGFRKNRSTIDAIFIVRQIVEKSLEFNKPAYICFIDMTKAFDRIRLKDVIDILSKKGVHPTWIELIVELNTKCKANIRTNHQLSEEISINNGVRQGDSLSPFLFSLIIDDIIEAIPDGIGYNMGNSCFNAVCYADDVVLIAETEDDLQRLLFSFNTKATQRNMQINTNKTKSMTIAKEPLRCKLEINNRMIQQVMVFNYLGVEISSDKKLYHEVKTQTSKAARISGCLKDLVWQNKFMRPESKLRIYKTIVRPVMTYAAETRPDTSKTMQLMTTVEMKTLRTIHRKTKLDRIRNEDLRQQSNLQDVTKLVRVRRKNWKNHVNRMDVDRLAKKALENTPCGRRMQGRPPKRWRECWTSTSGDAGT